MFIRGEIKGVDATVDDRHHIEQFSDAELTAILRERDSRNAADIVSVLQARGLTLFFDRYDLPSGLPWLRGLEKALNEGSGRTGSAILSNTNAISPSFARRAILHSR